ncbi:MAG: hypothetical protein HGGPFJEG_02364 [Ignavibacteria bacterium]|nr:hypothetical protein [Ignavibacteria bacterium]
MNEKKRYTAEQKITILRELLENNTPVSQVAEKYNVHVNDIYNWKKKLFENAASIFEGKSTAINSAQEKKIELLEAKLKKNADAINWLVFNTPQPEEQPYIVSDTEHIAAHACLICTNLQNQEWKVLFHFAFPREGQNKLIQSRIWDPNNPGEPPTQQDIPD